MLTEVIILFFIYIFITKREFIKDYKFNNMGLLFLGLSFGILNFVFINFIVDYNFASNVYYWFTLFTFLFLIIFLLSNYNNKGFIVIAIGYILNLLPISLNGKMPVSLNSLKIVGDVSKIDSIKNGTSISHGIFNNPKLFFLSDIIPIPKPYIYPRVISIGDILISVGIFIGLLLMTRRKL